MKKYYCNGSKRVLVDNCLELIKRQRAKIAVLSLENANSKICVEDLNAELENKNVEIDILIRKKKTLRDEISELTVENEKLQHKISELQHGILNCKSEAIREFAERLKAYFSDEYLSVSVWILGKYIDILVKEMVGDAK